MDNQNPYFTVVTYAKSQLTPKGEEVFSQILAIYNKPVLDFISWIWERIAVLLVPPVLMEALILGAINNLFVGTPYYPTAKDVFTYITFGFVILLFIGLYIYYVRKYYRPTEAQRRERVLELVNEHPEISEALIATQNTYLVEWIQSLACEDVKK